MLKEVKTIVKKSFKKNKNTIYIVVILLITSTFLIQSMPYPLVKPFHNRIINIGLIIGIMIHIYYKNACLAFLLLLTLIVINYYGVTKQKVYSYNNTHTDKYLIEDNSIFSNIKLLFNNHSEYFTEFVEGGGGKRALQTTPPAAPLRSTSLVPVNNSTKITLEQLSRSTSTTLPSSTASSTASPTTTDNTPRSTPLPPGFSSNGKPPPVTPTATAPPTATAEGRVNGGFMGAELFSAQNNVVPESTKVDNVQQPVEGINEYGCGGGNILNTDSPMGFDPKCQMNCSNV